MIARSAFVPCIFVCLTVVGCTPSKEPLNSPQVAQLTAPIEIVEAVEYMDGGTVAVLLRDATGEELQFCVSQDAFEEPQYPKCNTLFIGAAHFEDPAARESVGVAEKQLVIDNLRKAIEASELTSDDEILATTQDPAEAQIRSRYLENTEAGEDDQRWKCIIARHALQRLEQAH